MHQCSWWASPLAAYGVPSVALGCWRNGTLVGGALFRSYSVPMTGMSISECVDGPIFLEWERGWAQEFVAGVGRLARTLGSMAVVIKGCPRRDVQADLQDAFRRAGLRVTLGGAQADAVLPLAGRTLDEIRRGFNHGTKWRVNKGRRSGLVIRRLTTDEELEQAHAAWLATAARKGFEEVRPWATIQPVLRHCVDHGLGSVLASIHDGRLVAAAFVTHLGQTGVWVYGGYLDGAEPLNPTHVLQYEAMQECLSRGMARYNFGSLISYGAPTTSGVDEFKLGFGAAPVEHPEMLTWERRPGLYRCVEGLRRRRLGRHLEGLLKRRLIRGENGRG
jgi:hypothetical protein